MNKNIYLRKILVQNNLKGSDIKTNLEIIEDILLFKVKQYKETRNINLIVNYYKDQQIDRSAEIDLCLKLNCVNKLFNRIIIINETMKDIDFIDKSDRIIILNNPNRLTFNEIFNISNDYSLENTTNILINSDIVIGENFDNIKLDYAEWAFVLSRYNILDDGKINFCDDPGSFDTWIWEGKLKHNIGNYLMGKPNCDVLLANELSQFYKMKNPSYDLKTYHVHNTNIRNYNISEKISGKYLKIKITDLKIIKTKKKETEAEKKEKILYLSDYIYG